MVYHYRSSSLLPNSTWQYRIRSSRCQTCWSIHSRNIAWFVLPIIVWSLKEISYSDGTSKRTAICCDGRYCIARILELSFHNIAWIWCCRNCIYQLHHICIPILWQSLLDLKVERPRRATFSFFLWQSCFPRLFWICKNWYSRHYHHASWLGCLWDSQCFVRNNGCQ